MSLLVIALGFFAAGSWASTALLVRAAAQSPRIGALVERAFLAVLLSVYGTLGVLLVWNTETGFALFDIEVARFLFRTSLFLLFFMPIAWLALFGTNRLGGGS